MSEVADRARRRIGQLVRLLSSDQPGEAGAAAQALTRALSMAGVDIHQFAEVVEAGLPLLEEPARRPLSASPRANARRPEPPLTMGEALVSDQPAGVFRPCGCGGILFSVAPGVGPHVARLVCDACGSGGRWLGRKHFEAAPS